MITKQLQYDFDTDVDTLFKHFSDVNAVAYLCKAKSKRIITGQGDHGNGVGATRRVSAYFGLISLDEAIRTFEPPSLIEYEVVRCFGVRRHWGRMEFLSTGPDRSQLRYTIDMETFSTLLDNFVQTVLHHLLNRGMAELQKALPTEPAPAV